MSVDIPFGTTGEDLPEGRTLIKAIVDCENIGKLLHRVQGYQTTEKPGAKEMLGGRQEELTFYVDEPPRLGGDGKYPQPLTYIAGGVGA